MFTRATINIKNIIVPFFLLFILSACMSTPKLTAYVDKESLTEYDIITYTVVYQGYAEKYDIDFSELNKENQYFYDILDINHQIDQSIVDGETKYVTTWKVPMVVVTNWVNSDKLIMPALPLNDLETPVIKLHVENSPEPDFAEWVGLEYNNEVAINEKVAITAYLRVNDEYNFDKHYSRNIILPGGDYDHVFMKSGSSVCECNNLYTITTTFYFDKPGVYTLSPFNIFFVNKQKQPLRTYGADAPEFTITVK